MPSKLLAIVALSQSDRDILCKASDACRCKVPRRRSSGRTRDMSLSLLGLLGWLALPKCPMCLAVYVSMATGIGLSFTASHSLYYSLGAIALAALFIGLIRMIRAFKQKRHAN